MKYGYCVQCRDSWSGKTGDFVFESSDGSRELRKTISPVFDSLAQLFPWMRENGFERDNSNGSGPFDLRKVK